MNKEQILTQLHFQEGNHITCQVCQRECCLGPGQTGYCSGYANEKGKFTDLTFGRITSAQVTELGWAPVKMFGDPKTKVLSVSGRGCNFYCGHCVNMELSHHRHDRIVNPDQIVPPEVLIEYAKALDCKAIAANFNEALLAVAYWRETFELAKQAKITTVAVTNGYYTPEVLDIICPQLDVYRCDIKAIAPDVMQTQTAGISPQGVLSSLKYIKVKYPNTHIEIVTMLVPGINDSQKELGAITNWIYTHLGSETPWHISPFESIENQPLNGSPAYLLTTDLLDGNRVTTSSIVFAGSEVVLHAGQMSLDNKKPNIHPELIPAFYIGREAGLKNVFVKTDGY